MAMTNSTSRKDYLKELKTQYREAKRSKNKKTKTELLNQAVSITGLNRKYLIRLLGDLSKKSYSPFSRDRTNTRGRKPMYDSIEFKSALLVCWRSINESCAENLQPFLVDLVPHLEALGELNISDKTKGELLQVSVSTIARILKQQYRSNPLPFGFSTTRPGNLLKSQIAVRRGRWDETEPGCLETDTVAHCGDQNVGQYIHSYNFVDIATSWSEQVACMGIGETATIKSIKQVRDRLPFKVNSIDCDNGSEFINWHLMRYCQKEAINFTRSRPYKKNDNAHVEQKNNTAIRKMVGYGRYDTTASLDILNQLYAGPLRLYLNYFQPTRKRKIKLQDKSSGKTTKFYFEAKTPYQRIMECSTVDESTKQMLQLQYNKLNPVKLLAQIQHFIDILQQ
jgi:hypothetical protein